MIMPEIWLRKVAVAETAAPAEAAAENVTVMENVTANKLLNLEFDALDLMLKEYALKNNVPIILDEGLAFLESVIALNVRSGFWKLARRLAIPR